MTPLWLEVDEEGTILRRSEEVAGILDSLEPRLSSLDRVLELRADLRAAILRRAGHVRFGVGRGAERVTFDADVSEGAHGARIVLVRVDALADDAELGRLLVAHAEHHSDAFLVTDPDGVILWCDASFCHLVGYERREVVGRHKRLYRSAAVTPREVEAYWRSLFATGTFSGNWTLRRSDGVDLPVAQSVSAVRDAVGRTTHYVAMFRDISRERELERIRSYDLAVHLAGALVGEHPRDLDDVADELLAVAEQGLRSADPAVAAGAFERIAHIAARLNPIAQDLRLLSRSPTTRGPTDLGRVARELAALGGRLSRPAGASVRAEAPEAGPWVACAEADVVRAAIHPVLRALEGVADGVVTLTAAEDYDEGVLRIRYSPTANERMTLRKLFPDDGVTGPIGNELRTRALGGGLTLGLEDDREGNVAICVRSLLAEDTVSGA